MPSPRPLTISVGYTDVSIQIRNKVIDSVISGGIRLNIFRDDRESRMKLLFLLFVGKNTSDSGQHTLGMPEAGNNWAPLFRKQITIHRYLASDLRIHLKPPVYSQMNEIVKLLNRFNRVINVINTHVVFQ